jgi:DNA-binding NarL/FixJ family response regulator
MLARPRLLVADDHLSYAEAIGRWFAPRFDVQTPVTVLDELDQEVTQGRPDVLLLDIQFGTRSALDILPAIARHTRTRILMFTAWADVRRVVRAFDAGAVGYFLKEDGLVELRWAVDQVLAGVRYIAPELRSQFEALQHSSTISLTRRQRELLEAVQATASNQDAAARLGISLGAFEKRLRALKTALGMRNTHRRLTHDVAPITRSGGD